MSTAETAGLGLGGSVMLLGRELKPLEADWLFRKGCQLCEQPSF